MSSERLPKASVLSITWDSGHGALSCGRHAGFVILAAHYKQFTINSPPNSAYILLCCYSTLDALQLLKDKQPLSHSFL